MGNSDKNYLITETNKYLLADENAWFTHIDGSRRFYNTNIKERTEING